MCVVKSLKRQISLSLVAARLDTSDIMCLPRDLKIYLLGFSRISESIPGQQFCNPEPIVVLLFGVFLNRQMK